MSDSIADPMTDPITDPQNIEMLKLLVSRGANLNHKSNISPLFQALLANNLTAALFLLGINHSSSHIGFDWLIMS